MDQPFCCFLERRGLSFNVFEYERVSLIGDALWVNRLIGVCAGASTSTAQAGSGLSDA
jgi:hypothetical protein